MTAAEIREDMVSTLRNAARGYEQLAVGRGDIASRCFQQADDLRAKARKIELRAEASAVSPTSLIADNRELTAFKEAA